MSANSYNNLDVRPSDLDDSLPTSNLSAFQEVDYRPTVKTVTTKRKLYGERRANPDTRPEPERVPNRVSWPGIILQKISNNNYLVKRHDGKDITASTFGDDHMYEGISVGDMCVLEAGPLKDQWFIISSAKNKELSSMTLANSKAYATNNKVKIVMDVIKNETGKNVTFNFGGGGAVCKSPGGLGGSAQYLITISATIRSDGLAFPFEVENVCTSEDITPTDGTARTITFDRQFGLASQYSETDCTARVGFNLDLKNSVLQCDLVEKVIWSNGLTLGSTLEVGADVAKGVVKIGGKASHAYLAPGNKKLKMMFPNNTPTQNAHLIVESNNGEVVQSKWSAAGKQGTIIVKDVTVVEGGITISETLTGSVSVWVDCCDAYAYGTVSVPLNITIPKVNLSNKTYTVKDGLLINGPGLTLPSSTPTPEFPNPPSQIWTCPES